MRRRGEIRSSLRTSALGRSEHRARIRASTGRGSRAGCLVLPYALRLVPLISASLMRLTPLASRRSSHAAARRYAPPLAAGSNPTQWIEANKGGITADVRDALLREKEKGEVQASAKMAPGVLAALDKPGNFHSPATDVGEYGAGLLSPGSASTWCSLQSQPLPPPAPALPPPLPTHLPLPDRRLEQPRLRTPQARSSSGRAAGVRLAAWQGPQLEAG